MMVDFQIPKVLKPGFTELVELSDAEYTVVIELLRTMPAGMGPSNFQKLFFEKIPHEKVSILPHLIFSFGSLLLGNIGTDFSTLAKKLAKSYDEGLSGESFEKLCYRLKDIFENSDNLKYTIKALELLSENDHVYTDSRVITDIRTIFNDDLNDSRRMAVIFHNLKFEYRHNGEHKEFYFSLDNADLIKLKEKIERALEKEKAIKNDYQHSFNFITIND